MNDPSESPDHFTESQPADHGWMEQALQHRPSTIGLLVANAVPLLGVFLFGWSTFAIVALYWSENVIIGAINVLKILFADPSLEKMQSQVEPKTGEEREHFEDMTNNWDKHSKILHRMKFFLIPFFIVHYGLFCTVHGIFIFALLGRGGDAVPKMPGLGGMLQVFTQEHLWWGVGALAISHLISFVTNYLGREEYKQTNPIILMFQPYVRIVVLHIAILLGAFVTIALGSSVGILVLLIAGKTVLDLSLHLREHQKFNPSPSLLSMR